MSITKNRQALTKPSLFATRARFLMQMNVGVRSMAHFGAYIQGYKEYGSPNLQTTFCGAGDARKRAARDWKNHFVSPMKNLYEEIIGQSLIYFGYEQPFNW